MQSAAASCLTSCWPVADDPSWLVNSCDDYQSTLTSLRILSVLHNTQTTCYSYILGGGGGGGGGGMGMEISLLGVGVPALNRLGTQTLHGTWGGGGGGGSSLGTITHVDVSPLKWQGVHWGKSILLLVDIFISSRGKLVPHPNSFCSCSWYTKGKGRKYHMSWYRGH